MSRHFHHSRASFSFIPSYPNPNFYLNSTGPTSPACMYRRKSSFNSHALSPSALTATFVFSVSLRTFSNRQIRPRARRLAIRLCLRRVARQTRPRILRRTASRAQAFRPHLRHASIKSEAKSIVEQNPHPYLILTQTHATPFAPLAPADSPTASNSNAPRAQTPTSGGGGFSPSSSGGGAASPTSTSAGSQPGGGAAKSGPGAYSPTK